MSRLSRQIPGIRGSLPPQAQPLAPGRTLASSQVVPQVTARLPPGPGWAEADFTWRLAVSLGSEGEGAGGSGVLGGGAVRGGQTPPASCGAHGAGVGLKVAGPTPCRTDANHPEMAAIVPPEPHEDSSRPPISQMQEFSGVTPGTHLITPQAARAPPPPFGLDSQRTWWGAAPVRSP